MGGISPLFITLENPWASVIEHHHVTSTNDYNRASGDNLIGADDDLGAALAFLREFQEPKSTLRVYAKELERLFLWCQHKHKISIANLKRDDLITYQTFLKNPVPTQVWCGSKAPRVNKDGSLNSKWRVFYKPLSDTSVNKSMAVIDALFNYLVQGQYFLGNPMATDRRRKKSKANAPTIIDRYLELDEIKVVLKALLAYPVDSEETKFRVLRAHYIILLLFYTGLRIAEASHHKMGDFILRENEWFLRIIGKGSKLREVPVPDELLDALIYFRTAIGLHSPLPKFSESTPLIPSNNLKSPISTRRIDQILKWAFGLGADVYEFASPHKASKLHAASAHWLRHSYVTYLLDNGASLKVAQKNAGHSNIATTMHYRHVGQADRHEQTRTLSLSQTNADNKKSKDQ